jgi:hypothetical protein
VKNGVSRKSWACFIIAFASLFVLLYVFVNEIKRSKTSSLITHKIDDYEFNLTTPITTGSIVNLVDIDEDDNN